MTFRIYPDNVIYRATHSGTFGPNNKNLTPLHFWQFPAHSGQNGSIWAGGRHDDTAGVHQVDRGKRGGAGSRGRALERAGAGSIGPASAARAAAATPSLTPYLDPMPLLVNNAIDATGGGTVKHDHGADLPQGSQPATRDDPIRVPAFGGPVAGDTAASYLGPTIVAKSGTAVKVTYSNGLAPNDFLRVFTNGGASYLQFPPFPEVRILTHLHGGFVAGNDDVIRSRSRTRSGPGKNSR